MSDFDPAHTPGSPEWSRLMTASKVAAVLGLSPWESPRSMWHIMRGDLDGQKDTAATRRGHYLEEGVIRWWLDQHPTVDFVERQRHLTLGDWGAATPDLIGDDDGFGNAFVLDAKTSASADDWGTPGTDEAPAYYVAQAMWQLACRPQAQVAYIAVLFGRPQLAFEEYVIQRDDDLIADIVAQCRAFYDSLSADAPPPLDDTVATYEAIRSLHPDIDREAEVELTEDEARAFTLTKAQLDSWDAEHRAAKSALLERMGTARVAKHNGQVIARRQANKYGVSLVAVAKHTETENVA